MVRPSSRPRSAVDGVEVQQGLGRVLPGPVAAVDDGMLRHLRRPLRRTHLGVANDDDVGILVHRLDRILQRLPFGHGGGLRRGEAHDAPAQPVHSRFKGKAGPGAGLKEERRQDVAIQEIQGRGSLQASPECIGDVHNPFQFLTGELSAVQDIRAFQSHSGLPKGRKNASLQDELRLPAFRFSGGKGKHKAASFARCAFHTHLSAQFLHDALHNR